MSEPPPKVSMDKGSPADDLARARQSVLAVIAGSAASMRAPTLNAAAPLSRLSPDIEAKLANRALAGLEPLGTAHPRGHVWQRVVLPSGSFAALDALGAGVAAADGHPILAIGAAVLFVPFAALAASAARWAARDPLRLTTGERRAITNASHWESHQLWTGALSFGAERGLVIAATYAAERIARSPAWRSGHLDEHRVRLNLVTELDQIDEQAHRIAAARNQGGQSITPGSFPAADQAWDAVLTRVAALTCYAESLDGLAKQQAEAMARRGDPVRDSALMAGSVQDEIAVDDLATLTYFLTAAVFNPQWNGSDF